MASPGSGLLSGQSKHGLAAGSADAAATGNRLRLPVCSCRPRAAKGPPHGLQQGRPRRWLSRVPVTHARPPAPPGPARDPASDKPPGDPM